MAVSEENLKRLNVAAAIVTLEERTRFWHIALILFGLICMALGIAELDRAWWVKLVVAYGGLLVIAGLRVRVANANEGMLLAALGCASLALGVITMQVAVYFTSPNPRIRPGALILAFFAGRFAWDLWTNRKTHAYLASLVDPLSFDQTQKLVQDARGKASHLMHLHQADFISGGKHWWLALNGDAVGVVTMKRRRWKLGVDEVFWVPRDQVALQPKAMGSDRVQGRIGGEVIKDAKLSGEGALMFGLPLR